jgi:hypothetical protein
VGNNVVTLRGDHEMFSDSRLTLVIVGTHRHVALDHLQGGFTRGLVLAENRPGLEGDQGLT